MSKKCKREEVFYGTTTVGEKGQVVIPSEAREAMKLQKGDKLLVFGMGCDMIAFSKLSNLEKFAEHLSKRLDAIRTIIKKTE
jgi:AbrB family looped-hinge helix DNA binding protein